MNWLKKLYNSEPGWKTRDRESNLRRKEIWEDAAALHTVLVVEGDTQSAQIIQGEDHLDITVWTHLDADPARWSFNRFVLSPSEIRRHLLSVRKQAADYGHYRIKGVALGRDICAELYPVLESFLAGERS